MLDPLHLSSAGRMAVEKDIVADHVQDKAKLELHKQHSVCLVLDFGSQYTQLIGRRVRSLNVYSMLKPGDISLVRYEACMLCDLAVEWIRQSPTRRRCIAPPPSPSQTPRRLVAPFS